MTQTLTRTDQWLADFGAALEQGDVDRAAGMFAAQSFWRDLIAFSWNIITVEGPEGVRDLLRGTLATTKPTGWHTTEEPAEAGGVTEAWIEFETAVGRGKGHLRLRGDGELKAWTLLTTLYELKGHEEPAYGRRARAAPSTASNRDRADWLEQREREAAELGHDDPAGHADRRRRPGRHRPRRPAAPARRADDRRGQARPPRRPVAQPLQEPLPARPGLVRPPARTSSSPRTGRSSRPRTRSPTGSSRTRG